MFSALVRPLIVEAFDEVIELGLLLEEVAAGRLGGLEREGAPPDRSAPALSHCRPDRCPNACITRRHLAPWQMSIAEGEEMLRTKRLSSLQRQIIADDNERKQQLIAPLLEGSPQ